MATAQGLGKRVPLSEFRLVGRGGTGVICIKLAEGDALVGLQQANAEEAADGDCLVATTTGLMSRTPVGGFPVRGRLAKGVRMVQLQGQSRLSSVSPCRYQR